MGERSGEIEIEGEHWSEGGGGEFYSEWLDRLRENELG